MRCLKSGENLIIEAGTGIGKSFAYLIPAVLSQKKTVISTATLALQDQLVKKDLVSLHETLPQEFSYDLLKGKNNYLCLKRAREYSELGEAYTRFRKWLSKTTTGEKDELPFVPEFWSRVCGDSQDCNGRRCPFYDNCFYCRHYRRLYKKDILVVNHHLLIHDLLSEFNILPFHEQLIIDEAHDIESVISHVLGSTLNHSRLTWLLYRLRGLKITVDNLFAETESFFKKMGMPEHTVCPIPAAVIEKLINMKKTLALNKVVSMLEEHKKQALLYIDRNLPEPDEDEEMFQRESLKVMEELIRISRGRALALFTSYKHLRFVSKNIRIDYPVKSQGEMPPPRLIEWFKDTPHSVILATATFWQGVDIRGDKLSLVIIEKLPFSSPGDPVYQERCRRLKKRWFSDLALPSAILTLRQGFGRLIRGPSEYGVVAILDKRLLTRSYGKTIVASLPELGIVHTIGEVKNFFDAVPGTMGISDSNILSP